MCFGVYFEMPWKSTNFCFFFFFFFFSSCSSVSIVNFEHVNAGWVIVEMNKDFFSVRFELNNLFY